MITILKKVFGFFASYGLACVILILMLVVTFVGTLAQVDLGIYDVQQKYFNALFLVHYLPGNIPLPLPGGLLLMSLLFVNIVCGGVIRLRKSRRKAGILVTHLGIILMLIGGLITFVASTDGHMTLYENESSDVFQSYYEWELVIDERLDDGTVREHIIPNRRFSPLAADEFVEFYSSELPVRIVVQRFMRNCRPMPKGPMFEAPTPVIDGFFLQPLVPNPQAEQNVAGIYATLTDVDSGASTEGMLWGMQQHPWVVDVGDNRWACHFRPRRWKLPFEIVLNTFTRELHPGTSIAKVFMSDVTKIENGVERSLKITMNEPLRHQGYTLFQASWGPQNARPGDPLFSTFAVVRNPADRLPLYACIVIAIGLLIQFCQKLAGYIRASAAIGLFCCLFGPTDLMAAERLQPWSPEVIRQAAAIPCQDGGRIKPLDTVAQFKLLRFNGKRKCTTPSGERLSATEWMLDCLFFPAAAEMYPVFLVANDQVLNAIQIDHAGKKKRDRYTYRELQAGRDKLFELATDYVKIDVKLRSPVETQIVALAENITDFEWLTHYLDFARTPLERPSRSEAGAELVKENIRASALMRDASALLTRYTTLEALVAATSDPILRADIQGELNALLTLFEHLQSLGKNAASLALFPPSANAGDKQWLTPGDVINGAFMGHAEAGPLIDIVVLLENMVDAREQPDAFAGHMDAFSAALGERATVRGEYWKVPLEVTYYRADFFYRGLVCFIFAFLLAALLWLRPGSTWLKRGVWFWASCATVILIAGIVVRCVIRGRPPVSTLYESILFITAVVVVTSLVIELINKKRIGLTAATCLGCLGLFLANKYEIKESTDTMTSLVAVLDSNFWLSTHVTTVTVGYAAGLLASAIAHIYIIGRLLGIRHGDTAFYKDLARMVYGVICFGLFFSVIGTILGGIWANDSWGRFWGWDPKENGAFMIILWELAILHARLGRYIRDLGICMAGIATGCIVSFSWWGVNLLGVGLHSYGFTSGVSRALTAFYAVETVVILAGAVVWIRDKTTATASSHRPVAANEAP